jgi:gamma-glutamyltranspeptidase
MQDNIKMAIDAPRIHHQLLPMKAKIEMGLEKVEILFFHFSPY